MNVIHMEEEAFFELIEKVVERIATKYNAPPDKWIDGGEAMQKLGIKSPTTLQKYRDEGRIRFTQPDKKIILYDRYSIDEFLEDNAKETF
ncbi:MAG: helix-turn-helix domain-containing protein [Cyclobacteriaceae bacterium]